MQEHFKPAPLSDLMQRFLHHASTNMRSTTSAWTCPRWACSPALEIIYSVVRQNNLSWVTQLSRQQLFVADRTVCWRCWAKCPPARPCLTIQKSCQQRTSARGGRGQRDPPVRRGQACTRFGGGSGLAGPGAAGGGPGPKRGIDSGLHPGAKPESQGEPAAGLPWKLINHGWGP